MGSVRSGDERVDCHRLLVHLHRIIRVPVAMGVRALVQSARVCAIDANRQARVRRMQLLVFVLRVQLLEATPLPYEVLVQILGELVGERCALDARGERHVWAEGAEGRDPPQATEEMSDAIHHSTSKCEIRAAKYNLHKK